MANISLSVIIPSKNNKYHVSDIIKRIAAELPGEEVEFIVIDMNSSDDSVICALEEIKNNHLRGCVIQSGGGSISSALNTGIYKSDGKYITFVYPSRMYKNYIADYLKTADKTAAEFVFAVPSGAGGLPVEDNVLRRNGSDKIDASAQDGNTIFREIDTIIDNNLDSKIREYLGKKVEDRTQRFFLVAANTKGLKEKDPDNNTFGFIPDEDNSHGQTTFRNIIKCEALKYDEEGVLYVAG